MIKWLSVASLCFWYAIAATPVSAAEPIYVYSYTDPSCLSCSSMAEDLAILADRYPEVRILESDITTNPAQETILYDLLTAYDASNNSLPAVFVGDQSFVGYDQSTVQAIEQKIVSCRETTCPSPNEILQEYYRSIEEGEARQSQFPTQLFWALFVIVWPAAGLIAIVIVWRRFRKRPAVGQ